MKTVSFIYEGNELPTTLATLKGNILIQIYDSSYDSKLKLELIDKLIEMFDNPVIVGAEVPLSMSSGEYTKKINVIVSAFSSTVTKCRQVVDLSEFKKTIYSMIEPDTKGFLVLSDRLTKLEELSSDLKDFSDYYFFGSLGLNEAFCYCDKHEKPIKDGLIIVSFSGNIEIHSLNFTNYKGIGNYRKVTKASNGRVYEIEGVPFIDYYQEIFKHEKQINLNLMRYFPLVNKRLGDNLTYTPCKIYEDSSVEFPINFRKGDDVRIAFLDIYGKENSFKDLVEQISDYNIESIFTFSSTHKFSYNKKANKSSLKELNDKYVSVNGLLSDIQIVCSKEGYANFVTGATVGVTLSEGEHKINFDLDEENDYYASKEEVLLFDLIKSLTSDLEEVYEYYRSNIEGKEDERIEEVDYDSDTKLYNQIKLQKDINGRQFEYNITTMKLVNEKFLRAYHGNTFMNECKRHMIERILTIIKDKANLYYVNDGFLFSSTLKEEDHRKLLERVNHRIFKYGYSFKDTIIDFGVVYATCFKGNKHPVANSKRTLAEAIENGVEYAEYGQTNSYYCDLKEGFDQYALLTKAYQQDLFKVYFQGIYDTKLKRIEKYEGLVRIIDQDKVYGPNLFIDVAYKFGYGRIITKEIIKQVSKKIKETGFMISFNVRLTDLDDDELCEYFLNVTKEYDVRDKIVIEILEDDDIFRSPSYIERIKELRSYGVNIAVDDFGTGYSNLNYFNLDCFDYIKLAGDVVRNLTPENKIIQLLVESTTKMAHMSNYKVVAEYCENETNARLLESLGVDYIQGYYFSKPSLEIKK